VAVGPQDSIQSAVDAAAPGTRIEVSGTHRESVFVDKAGIKLIGVDDASLLPPADAGSNPCNDPEAINGICAVGDVDFDTGEVHSRLQGFQVSGFHIEGFSGLGIQAYAVEDLVVNDNVLANNGEYGVAAFESHKIVYGRNVAYGSEEANFYIGDTTDASATVWKNQSYDALFGFFLRNSSKGVLVSNDSHDNCLGVLLLAGAPGPVEGWHVTWNQVHDNNKACAPDEEEGTPPLSGIGIAVVGAHHNFIDNNRIRNHVPSTDVPFSGGLVVISTDPPANSPAFDNDAVHNVFTGNQTDIFWDGKGADNQFNNVCKVGVPAAVCDGVVTR